MNLRRSSTFSPISVVKIFSAATTSSSFHLQQRARFGVHGGFPELLGIHFAQALEPGDGELFFGVLEDVGEHFGGACLGDFVAVARHGEGRLIGFGDGAGQRAQTLVIGLDSQRPIDAAGEAAPLAKTSS